MKTDIYCHNAKGIGLVLIVLLCSINLKGQGSFCQKLLKKNGIAYCNGQVFTGQYKRYDRDSILVIEKYEKGCLNGDSAIVKYYSNGLLMSVSSFNSGKFLQSKKMEFFRLSASIGGKTGGLVDRNWLILQNELKISLKVLTDKEVSNSSINDIILNRDFQYASYRIIGYVFAAEPCANCPDIERISFSDSIPKSIKSNIIEKRRKSFYFYDIKYVNEQDTIMLPTLTFKVN